MPAYNGEIQAPKAGLAFGALVGMAVLSWLHLSPATMVASAPWLHKGCMLLVGGSTGVVAGIFNLAWLAHVAEALYAVKILASHPGWLRVDTVVPWFSLVFLFGYPQLCRLTRADKEGRTPKSAKKRI